MDSATAVTRVLHGSTFVWSPPSADTDVATNRQFGSAGMSHDHRCASLAAMCSLWVHGSRRMVSRCNGGARAAQQRGARGRHVGSTLAARRRPAGYAHLKAPDAAELRGREMRRARLATRDGGRTFLASSEITGGASCRRTGCPTPSRRSRSPRPPRPPPC